MVSRYGYNPDDINKYQLSLNWQCTGKKPFVIDAYGADNGTPEVVTVFYTKNRDVIALLKWQDGAKDSTVVRYKVFAYRYVGDISDTAFFRLDRLSERFGEGFDGVVNGKPVEYPFKTASSIRKQLAEFGQ